MKPEKEKNIQAKAIKYAKSKGAEAVRMYFGPGMRVGWPDVLFLLPGGRPLFIEFKSTGKKPTKLQEHKIALLNHLGFAAVWVDSLDSAKKIINEALEKGR